MTDARATTVPPAAKVVTAKGAAVSGVLSIVAELVVVLVAAWLRSMGDDILTEQNFMIIVCAALVGPAASKMRGGPPTGTAALVLGALPWLAKKIALT